MQGDTNRQDVWPTEIRLRPDKKSLAIRFDNGEAFEFSAEFLRVTSPSAEVQGHGPDEKKTIGGKRNIEIMSIEPVGNYALRIAFTDLHNTGFFSWDYFIQSGRKMETIWQDYLDALAEKNLSRDS